MLKLIRHPAILLMLHCMVMAQLPTQPLRQAGAQHLASDEIGQRQGHQAIRSCRHHMIVSKFLHLAWRRESKPWAAVPEWTEDTATGGWRPPSCLEPGGSLTTRSSSMRSKMDTPSWMRGDPSSPRPLHKSRTKQTGKQTHASRDHPARGALRAASAPGFDSAKVADQRVLSGHRENLSTDLISKSCNHGTTITKEDKCLRP